MRELLNSEVNLVSGAGVVTNNEVGGQGHYQISLLPSFGPVLDPISLVPSLGPVMDIQDWKNLFNNFIKNLYGI